MLESPCPQPWGGDGVHKGGGRRMCCMLIHDHIVLILVMKFSGAKGTPETIYLAYQMESNTPVCEGMVMA